MADATKFENVRALADTNTITGPCIFSLLLSAGSDAAALTLTVGGSSIVIKAATATSQELSNCIKLGGGQAATVTLTGTGATAYAIDKVS